VFQPASYSISAADLRQEQGLAALRLLTLRQLADMG